MNQAKEMPLIVKPARDTSNLVGKLFRKITITLSISLPVSVFLLTLLWGYKNGFNSFF